MSASFKIMLLIFICLSFSVYCFGQSLERYRTLKDSSFVSKNLGYKKHVQITVPIEYQETLQQSFPLVVIFDMQNQRQYQYLLKSIDFLTANEQMPSAVIVGVESGGGGNRYRETQLKVSDTLGIGEKNDAYIFKELIPLLRSRFKVSDFTMLIGHSRYGFFTTYLMAKHPKELNAVVSISPFLQQRQFNLTTMLKQEIKKNKPKHMVYYRYAMGNDNPEDYKRLTKAIKGADFRSKNFNVEGWWFPEADHNTTPALTIIRSLYEVFEYWHSCQSQYLVEGNNDLGVVDELKQKIKQHYGTSVPFSLGILNGKGYAFYNKADYANAIVAWRQLVALYPNFAQGYLNIAKCEKALMQPTDQTIREFKVSLSESSIFNADQRADLLKEAEGF
ncbi:Putative esterase [Pedobacter sp. ok626]|uniref:alpha/beta hydrolase-fold protein n=1 Tax=Pedobacter sp. ok626 TaxID=1761882 RepID=UPI0008884FA3|nr:alpha/beta hydrolase-fold protein [Pedobacter sp. ok626]SDK39555.1 Putative esterase [Pedobacter sp. ok626]